MRYLKALTKPANILVNSLRYTSSSQPADYIRTNLHNGVGRYVCQLQRITFKFCKGHPNSRGISTTKQSTYNQMSDEIRVITSLNNDIIQNEQIGTNHDTGEQLQLLTLLKPSQNISNREEKKEKDTNKIIEDDKYRVLHLYTDGSHYIDEKKGINTGGAGVFIPNHTNMNVCRILSTERLTSYLAEIEAVIIALNVALEIIEDNRNYECVVINTDCMELLASIEKCAINYVAFTSQKEFRVYCDKYDKIVNLSKKFKKVKLKFNHVKGHSNIYGNEMADALAKKAQRPNMKESCDEKLKLYCDGLCLRNNDNTIKTGAIYVFVPYDKSMNVCRVLSNERLTSNLAELEAAIYALNVALEIIDNDQQYKCVTINTNSAFVLKEMEEWMRKRSSDDCDEDVMYRDKFLQLFNLLKKLKNIKLEWKQSENTDHLNNLKAKLLANNPATERKQNEIKT